MPISRGVQPGRRLAWLLIGLIVVSVSAVEAPAVRAATVTSTSITSAPTTLWSLEAGHFEAQVIPNPGAGLQVRWQQNNVVVEATTTDANGLAIWNRGFLAGTYAVVATFLGGNGFDPSVSGSSTVVVTKRPTSTTLETSAAQLLVGESFTLTATITPNPGPGQVRWFIGNTNIGTDSSVDPATGKASLVRSSNSTGAFSYTAEFVGSDGYAASTAAPVVVSVVQSGTATQLGSSSSPASVSSVVTLTATVSPNPGGGSVTFVYNNTQLQVVPVDASGVAQRSVLVQPGSVTATATFNGFGPHGPSTGSFVQVGMHPTTVSLTADRTAAIQYEDVVTFTASVGSPTGGPPQGTVSFSDTFNGATTTIGSATLSGSASISTATLAPGTHVIVATFAGSNLFFGASSQAFSVAVSPDVSVKVAGPRLQESTFYPVRDGYRDRATVAGTLAESASVSYVVYSPAGRKLKSTALGAKIGAFSFTWNGRNSAGTIYPAGTYKVVTAMTDLRGNVKKVSLSVVLSPKKLYWTTVSKTKTGDSFSRYYASGFAWVSLVNSRFDRGVNLYGNIYDSIAFVEYRFTLPSATVYKSLKFSVLGRPALAGNPGYMSFARTDGGEDGARFSGWSYAWYGSTVVTGAGHVSSSRVVRTYYTTEGWDRAHYDVAKVKLTYTYGILK